MVYVDYIENWILGINLDVYEKALLLINAELSEKFSAVSLMLL
jgi:hypothetical protein